MVAFETALPASHWFEGMPLFTIASVIWTVCCLGSKTALVEWMSRKLFSKLDSCGLLCFHC